MVEGNAMVVSSRVCLPAFALFWLMVMTVAFSITRSEQFNEHAELLSRAVIFDMVVLVPLVYVVLARRFGWRLLSAVPVLVVSLVAANLLVPAEHQGWLHGIELMLAPLEIGLVAYLVLMVRAVRRRAREAGGGADDFLEVLERVLREVTDTDRPARIMATEVAMLYYGLAGWWKKPADVPGRVSFSYHRSGGHGMIMSVFLCLVLVETGVLHWFLLPRIAWLAWLVLALSLYSVVFLLADLNAARLRPMYIEGGALVVRVALRWRARVPLAAITAVERSTFEVEKADGLLRAALSGSQDVILSLDQEVTAEGLYGFRTTFNRVALSVDDVAGFVEAINLHAA